MLEHILFNKPPTYLPIDLTFQIRQNDRLAVSKLVTSLTRGSVRSPLAQCLLIRYTSQVCYLILQRYIDRLLYLKPMASTGD